MITKDTILGEVRIKNCVIDIDGRNLEEGVDIFIDEDWVMNIVGKEESDFSVMSIEEIEKFLIKETPL